MRVAAPTPHTNGGDALEGAMSMYLAASRLFLLLLLIADWAGDPYFGHSPLSRPMASQEAFCQSLVYRTELCRATVPSPTEPSAVLIPFESPLWRALTPHLWEPVAGPAPPRATDPLYAFMSLQR
jgi:hypothetical protein